MSDRTTPAAGPRSPGPLDDRRALMMARVLAAFALVVGLAGLLAYLVDAPNLTRINPAWPAMRPWIIVLIILLATAILLQASRERHWPRILVARLLAGAGALGSVSFLLSGLLDRPNPLTDLLFPGAVAALDPPVTATPAPLALLIALLLNIHVALLWSESRWAIVVAGACSAVVTVSTLLAVLAFLFDARLLLGVNAASSIALPTAVCLLALLAAAADARPHRPPRAWYLNLRERGLAAKLAVRLIVIIVAVVLVRGIGARAGIGANESWLLAVGTGLGAMAWVAYRLVAEQRRLLEESHQLSEELAESRRTFRLVAENAGDIVLTTDQLGVITWISPSVTRVLGWTPEQLVGRDVANFVHPEDTDTARRAPRLTDLAEADPTVEPNVIIRVRRRDGGYRWMLDRASFLESAEDEGPGTIASLQAVDDLVETQQRLARGEDLLRLITQAQAGLLERRNHRELFDSLLESTLAVTGCEYGFIGEVLHRPSGAPYLKTWALTNIAWNDATRTLYEEQHQDGLEFDNLDTLFGATLRTGEPVLANDPYRDTRSGGLPREHPPMDCYLGLPLTADGSFVGMLGLANHPGGFTEDTIEFLRPLTSALGRLIAVRRAEITRQRDRKEIARLSTVVRQMTSGVAITDVEGRIEWVNDAFTTMFHRERDALTGVPISDVVATGETAESLHREILAGEPFVHDCSVRDADGREFQAEVDGTALRADSGAWDGTLVIVTDITERYAVARLKDEFVSTISHELRTPLTSLSGAIALLASTEADRLSPRAGRLLDMAERNASRLRTLINDLLDLEQLVAGGFTFEFADIEAGPLVERTVQECHGYAEQYGVAFRVTPGPSGTWVHVDADRLGQVVANLLSNAAKFSPAGSTVEIATTMTDTHVRIAVRDHGPGIPDEFRDRVFQKFAQADASSTRQHAGSGLGLAIARELVERMDGRIDYEAAPGTGTTFTVDLPRISPPTDAPRP